MLLISFSGFSFQFPLISLTSYSEGGVQKKTVLPDDPIKCLGQRTMDMLNITIHRPHIRSLTEYHEKPAAHTWFI